MAPATLLGFRFDHHLDRLVLALVLAVVVTELEPRRCLLYAAAAAAAAASSCCLAPAFMQDVVSAVIAADSTAPPQVRALVRSTPPPRRGPPWTVRYGWNGSRPASSGRLARAEHLSTYYIYMYIHLEILRAQKRNPSNEMINKCIEK